MNSWTGEMFNFNSALWYNNRRINKNTGEASLYIAVYIDRKHDEFPLKLRWPVRFIDIAKGELLKRYPGDKDYSDYNLIIKSEQAKHIEIFKTYRLLNKPLCIEEFSRLIKSFDQRESFLTFIKTDSLRRLKRKEIEFRTWQNAHAVRMCLIKHDPLCLFSSIDLKWMKDFKNFISNYIYKEATDKKPAKIYAPGQVWALIKVVKTYLKRASTEPLINVNEEAIIFNNPLPNIHTTYLSRDEIRRLMIIVSNGCLTSKQGMILKAFLFMCFTSLRISDLYRVRDAWCLEDDYLDFKPHKNRKRGRMIRIPLLPIAKKFIINISGNYFTLPSQKDFNAELKVIAVKARINKRLTAHVARHTFGYLYMTTVGNLYGLKEILGHAKIETTQRYAHLDDEYKLATTVSDSKRV